MPERPDTNVTTHARKETKNALKNTALGMRVFIHHIPRRNTLVVITLHTAQLLNSFRTQTVRTVPASFSTQCFQVRQLFDKEYVLVAAGNIDEHPSTQIIVHGDSSQNC